MWQKVLLHVYILLTVMLVMSRALHADQDRLHIMAVIGRAVTLSCPDHGPGDHLVWKDWVYNSGRDPIVIWDSETGKNTNHLNTANHGIGTNTGDLTISHLQDIDAGPYMCEVTRPGGQYKKQLHYELTMISLPTCSGDGNVREGAQVELSCTLEATGAAFPGMTWNWKNSRGVVASRDHSDFFEMRRDAHVKASYLDDGDTYTCEITAPGQMINESCSVSFNVQYAVRNLTVEPDQNTYTPGQTLRFHALGNPKPTLSLNPPASREGSHSVYVDITSQMVGNTYSYTFTAENSLSQGPKNLIKTFSVTEPTTPTTTIPKASAATSGG